MINISIKIKEYIIGHRLCVWSSKQDLFLAAFDVCFGYVCTDMLVSFLQLSFIMFVQKRLFY